MINFVTFLLASMMPLPDTGSIASNRATYDGAMLVLDGEVSLDHGFGMMKAEKAVLTRQMESQAEFPFTSIELAETVQILLSTKAEVDCERATLDFTTLKGVLTSPKNVHYKDVINSTPFELFSPYMDLQMLKKNKESYGIEKAYAQKGVHLIYDSLYHLKADSILFSQNNLSSDGDGCVWTYQNDRVDAKKFDLDLASKHLHLKQAVGHLSSFATGSVQFAAGDLDWEQAENHLVLRGMPKVQESSLGTITSDDEIDLILRDQKLHELKATGVTELVSIKGHSLKTDGSIDVNATSGVALIHSNTAQLQYKEEEIALMADEAEIHYREVEQKLHPERVDLQGNIKIFSQEKEGAGLRGVADTLTYHPETRACVLKALPGKKVLFSRDQDKLCISANEVHITYDPVSKEQQVRGIGHIVLSLTPQEQRILSEVFHHESSTP